jgi:hypothetical protein
MAGGQPYSHAENMALLNGADVLPGRSVQACQRQRQRLQQMQGMGIDVTVDTTADDADDLAPQEGIRSFEVKEGGAAEVEAITSKNVRTLEDLMQVCAIDPEQWEIVSWGVKAWQGFIKSAAKKIETTQLFAVNARLKPRKVVAHVRERLDAMLEEMRAAAPQAPPVLRVAQAPTGRMLELSIPDAHFGKLAWYRECGQSYDVKIAKAVFMAAVKDLLLKSAAYGPFEAITLVVGNDLLNADNFENTTARGTPQSTDGRQQRTFWTVRKVITEVIEELLRPLAQEVRVVMVSGNHDTTTNFYLGEVLDARFHNYPDVVVDNSPAQRKYLRWGDVLLMWTHGSEEKHADLPLIMAQERKADWGATRFKEIHLGHLHKKKAMNWVGVNEELGVTVRILPSLCASEDWHTSKGYIGNVRSAEAYIWDARLGLVGTAIYNVPEYTNELPAEMQVAA